MADNQIIEIEQDPLGYVPRPDLFVRNLTANTINYNQNGIRWSCPPWPSDDYQQPLPWTVARSAGFTRLWQRERVKVATDPDFDDIIYSLPEGVGAGGEGGGSGGAGGYVFRQTTPQAVVDITHGLARNGPVHVVVFSMDGQIEYWNFKTEMRDANTVRVSFDDPIAFQATVF